MQPGSSVQRISGTVMLAGMCLGFLPSCASANPYSEAVKRALRLLPRQPERILIVERPTAPDQHAGKPRTEAFINRGQPTVYLVRQGATLQEALKGPGIFDFALAAIIWHEMAHVDGGDENRAQREEEQLWRQFILGGRVDRTRGMQYLALLNRR
jgi:hypothetical protein